MRCGMCLADAFISAVRAPRQEELPLYGCTAVRLYGCTAVRLYGCTAVQWRPAACTEPQMVSCRHLINIWFENADIEQEEALFFPL